MPYTTGHQTLLVGGVLIDFEYSLDRKGVITITIGDPWEVITKKLSPSEFAARKQDVLRSVANMTSESIIECRAACEATFQAALRSGQNRFEALENYRKLHTGLLWDRSGISCFVSPACSQEHSKAVPRQKQFETIRVMTEEERIRTHLKREGRGDGDPG
jgi:hypothetical protein